MPPMDEKTREEVRQKLQEVRVLLEDMQRRNRRNTRIQLVLYGIALFFLSLASFFMSVPGQFVGNQQIIDNLAGIHNMSYFLMAISVLMTATGIIGQDRLDNLFKSKEKDQGDTGNEVPE